MPASRRQRLLDPLGEYALGDVRFLASRLPVRRWRLTPWKGTQRCRIDSDEMDVPGYFLPEDGQFRLKKLRDCAEFLSRLVRPLAVPGSLRPGSG